MIVHFNNPDKEPINQFEVLNGELHSEYTLSFVGIGSWYQYGDDINTNILRLAERSSYIEAPLNPIEGEIWFNPSTQTHYVSTVEIPYRAEVPADPPTIPFPIPEQPEVLQWIGLGEPLYRATPPLSEDVMWFDTNEQQLKLFYNEWVSVADNYLLLTGGTINGNLAHENTLTITNNESVANFIIDSNVGDPHTLQISDIKNDNLYRSATITNGTGLSNIRTLTENEHPSSAFESWNLIQSENDLAFTTTSNVVNFNVGNTAVLSLGSSVNRTFVPVDVSNNSITNVGFSSLAHSAIRRSDVDDLEQEWDSDLVNVAGDVFSGTIQVPEVVAENNTGNASFGIGDYSIESTSPMSINYQGSEFLSLSTLGELTSPSLITLKNVADPVNSKDSSTKSYVDGRYDALVDLINESNPMKANPRAWVAIRRHTANNWSYFGDKVLSVTIQGNNIEVRWDIPFAESVPSYEWCTITGRYSFDPANRNLNWSNWVNGVVDIHGFVRGSSEIGVNFTPYKQTMIVEGSGMPADDVTKINSIVNTPTLLETGGENFVTILIYW